jgi:hypothetical protein
MQSYFKTCRVMEMNESDGKKMEEIFFKYYYKAQIESLNDKYMLDKLVRAGHTEYSFEDGRAYAQATAIGKKLHYLPSPYTLSA